MGCIARLACWCVVLSTGSSASDFARHTFRLTPRVVRRLCVAAQRNPWAPRGRSRGPGDKRGAPARCLVLYRREPKRPKPVRDEAEAGRRTFSNICISRTSRVCIVPTHPTACPYSRVCMLGDVGVSRLLYWSVETTEFPLILRRVAARYFTPFKEPENGPGAR